MEWTVITVMVTIIGLFAAVGNPIAKLIQSITRLTVMLNTVTEELNETIAQNKSSHTRLWDYNKCQDEKLEEHEQRIFVIEQKQIDSNSKSQYNVDK